MATPLISRELQAAFRQAITDAKDGRHEYLTLEHLLHALTRDPKAVKILGACGANVPRLRERLEKFLAIEVDTLPQGVQAEPQQTIGIERVLQRAAIHALSTDQKTIDAGDVLVAMFREDESHALFLLRQEGVTRPLLLDQIPLADGGAEARRVMTEVSLPRDVWAALVRYRSEREMELERDVSTAEALNELLRKALGLEPPAPASD